MFFAICRHELKAWLQKPGLYFMALAFFTLPLFLFLGTGGYFDATPPAVSGEPSLLNSPFQIYSMLQYIGKLLLFLLPAIVGTALYEDFRCGAYKMLYAYPVPKGTYLSAKFSSTFTLAVVLSGLPLVALLAGAAILGPGSPYIGPAHYGAYAFTYGVLLLPNLLAVGLLVGSAVTLTRNHYAGFMLVLLLIAFQLLVGQGFGPASMTGQLLDPFGQYASGQQTQYWTTAERNRLPLSASRALVYNRLLWLGLGAAAAAFTYSRFSLSEFGWRLLPGWQRSKPAPAPSSPSSASGTVPVAIAQGRRQALRQCAALTWHQARFLFRHWVFHSFAVTGVLLLVFILHRVLSAEQVVMLPLTRLVLQLPAFFYLHLAALATFIFAGMLALRARDAGMEPLIHATATPTGVLVGSQALSLLIAQLALLLLLMGTGIAVQALHGHYHFELGQYLSTLGRFYAPGLWVWALLATGVFSLLRHLYAGLFLLLLAWLAQFGYEHLGISTRLLQFNTYGMLRLSDFHGPGTAGAGRMVLQAYWLAWGLLILYLAYLSWPRAYAAGTRERWVVAKRRVRANRLVPGLLLAGLAGLAGFVYRAEAQIFALPEKQATLQAFRARYGHLQTLPQPSIASVNLQMDIFPEQHAFRASGAYQLVNRTPEPIDTVLVRASMDEATTFKIGVASTLADTFPGLNFSLHRLQAPLMPGDTLAFAFTLASRSNTLFQQNNGVLTNGTFLTQDILPRIGYFLRTELPNPRRPDIPNQPYQAWDSDLVNFEATVSTSADQVAFANGERVGQWQAQGRQYFTYRAAAPIKFNFYFNSGVFGLHTARWADIPIKIYHHPAHSHNLESIAGGIRAALSFNSQLLGHAPQGAIRAIAYPLTEGSFSTLKSDALILSESVFGVNPQAGGKLNLPFYIAAHEMTHHWWGNALMPRAAKGAHLLTESLTEYMTLQIFRQGFGEAQARAFLEVQHRRYFSGRAQADLPEPPLMLVEPGQEYLSYGKGAIALHAIAQALGPEWFQQWAADFFKAHQPPAPYPTATDFAQQLLEAAGPEERPLIKEWLQRAVVYDGALYEGEAKPITGNRWALSARYRLPAFEGGQLVPGGGQARFELGVYNRAGERIAALPLPRKETQGQIRLTLEEPPHHLVLDPNYLVLDRDRTNNRLVLD